MNAVLHALAPYQPIAFGLVSYLVTALWLGIAIAALAALVVLWKPLDAATRYVIWYAALIAVVLGPLAVSAGIARAWHHAPAAQPFSVSTGDLTPPHVTARFAMKVARPSIALPPFVAFGAAALWLLVVLGGAARFVAGSVVLARLKRDALPLAPDRRAALPLWRTHATAHRARHARLCVSDRVDVPVAVGLFDGMIVLPQHVLDTFESGDVDRFVLHELAHLERRDDWTTVVQRLIQMVMFFNPAVHVIARRLDLEREIACDDRVIAATSDVRSYAVGLTRMAESTAWPHRGVAAPAIFITRRQLSVRVEELLTRPRSPARRIAIVPAAIAIAASLGVVAIAAPLGPLVGFGTTPPDTRTFANIRTKLMFVDGNGKSTTIDERRLGVGVMMILGDQQTVTELRALDPRSAPQFHALLKKMHDDKLAPAVADELLRTFESQHPAK
jgi:beta-lactamase regulating signal transducer with metallopeptidase domain